MLQRLPILGSANKDVNQFFVNTGGTEFLNGVIEFNGNAVSIRTRPGLVPHRGVTNSGVDGLYFWKAKSKILIVAGGRLFVADSPSDTPEEKTTPILRLPAGVCQFAEFQNFVYIVAESGRMYFFNGDVLKPVSDEIAPTNVSTITALNNRCIAVERGTTRIWYTNPVDVEDLQAPLVWSGFINATRSTDPILSLQTVGSELVVMRRSSIEYWYDDGVTPIRPIQGASIDLGIPSTRCVTKQGNTLFFFSSDRHFYALDGKQPRDLGKGQIDTEIQKINTINDVVATHTNQFIIFTFPIEKQTWVYDIKYQAWYQWTTLHQGVHREYLGKHAIRLNNGRWLLGGYDGRTYFMFEGVFRDGERPCQFRFRSSHYDLGTGNLKQSSRLLMKVSKEEVRQWFSTIFLPPAKRCHEYFYQMPEPIKNSYVVENLPTGFTYNAGTKTITSDDTDKTIGFYPVKITSINEWGAIYVQIVDLEITDFDPVINLVEE